MAMTRNRPIHCSLLGFLPVRVHACGCARVDPIIARVQSLGAVKNTCNKYSHAGRTFERKLSFDTLLVRVVSITGRSSRRGGT